MFPFWLILGIIMVLLGIFNKQMLRIFGFRSASELITTPNLRTSSRRVEQIARWLVIVLGMSFLVLGLGEILPDELSQKIVFWLMGLSALMLLAIIGITIANWRAR